MEEIKSKKKIKFPVSQLIAEIGNCLRVVVTPLRSLQKKLKESFIFSQ